MSKSHLLKYLLISPNLPVGGFCYSEGMESYLHNKNLKDSISVKDLIISELKIGQIRLDARLLLDFFDIFNEIKERKNLKINLQKLMSLDKWILSSKDSLEIREQQIQMAKSLFGLTKEFGFEYLFFRSLIASFIELMSELVISERSFFVIGLPFKYRTASTLVTISISDIGLVFRSD